MLCHTTTTISFPQNLKYLYCFPQKTPGLTKKVSPGFSLGCYFTVSIYQLFILSLSLPVLIISFCLKNTEMHHIAASATTIYRILLITLALPPNAQAIMSNPNRPTSPQLIPPTSNIKSAILSSIVALPSFR